MILKCIITYVLIGWLYEGIMYLVYGGIDECWNDVIKEEDFDKRYSQEAVNFVMIFSIIVIPFIWPACMIHGVYYCIKKSRNN